MGSSKLLIYKGFICNHVERTKVMKKIIIGVSSLLMTFTLVEAQAQVAKKLLVLPLVLPEVLKLLLLVQEQPSMQDLAGLH